MRIRDLFKNVKKILLAMNFCSGMIGSEFLWMLLLFFLMERLMWERFYC